MKNTRTTQSKVKKRPSFMNESTPRLTTPVSGLPRSIIKNLSKNS